MTFAAVSHCGAVEQRTAVWSRAEAVQSTRFVSRADRQALPSLPPQCSRTATCTTRRSSRDWPVSSTSSKSAEPGTSTWLSGCTEGAVTGALVGQRARQTSHFAHSQLATTRQCAVQRRPHATPQPRSSSVRCTQNCQTMHPDKTVTAMAPVHSSIKTQFGAEPCGALLWR